MFDVPYHCSAKNKLQFMELQSEEIFLGPKTKFLIMKSQSSKVVSIFCFCLFERMPFSKSQKITKPSDSKLKILLLETPVRCHYDRIHIVRSRRVFLGFFLDFGSTVKLYQCKDFTIQEAGRSVCPQRSLKCVLCQRRMNKKDLVSG